MSFLTNSLPGLAAFTGLETIPADTNLASGANPSQVALSLYKLATILASLSNTLSKTMVAGTIYYTQIGIGASTSFEPDALLAATSQSVQSYLLNGLNVLVGGTGGTDTWYVGLYTSAGVLLASNATGVTAGTASTVQQIAFVSTGTTKLPVTVPSGDYLLALQSSGTTATFGAINSPIWPKPTGSQTGVASTLAAISSVATTYTADLGPMASVY